MLWVLQNLEKFLLILPSIESAVSMRQQPWVRAMFDDGCDGDNCKFAATIYIRGEGKWCVYCGPSMNADEWNAIKTLRKYGLVTN